MIAARRASTLRNRSRTSQTDRALQQCHVCYACDVRFFGGVGVYFDDLDPFHILHNSRYLLLFERTIGAFWMELGLGGFADLHRPEQIHVVARNEIDYVSPVRGVCKVRVRVWVSRVGRTSLTFGMRLWAMDEDINRARGLRTIVHVDAGTLKPSPWSASVLNAIAPYCEPPTPA